MDGISGEKRSVQRFTLGNNIGVVSRCYYRADLCRTLAICLALIAAVGLIYAQTGYHHFIVCDDGPYVYANPYVPMGLTSQGVNFALTGSYDGNWHPLTWLSHMFDVTLYRTPLAPGAVLPDRPDPLPQDYCHGDEYGPGGHHLNSVVLHAATAVLLFLALRQMTGMLWSSVLVAALFAVHPLRVESVAWIAERKDVLSGVFWMLTLLCYGWYAKRPGLRGLGRYLTVLVSLALGLSAKSMLVTLPCVLLLLDVWPLRRWPSSLRTSDLAVEASPRFPPCPLAGLLIEKLPLFGLSIGVCVLVAQTQISAGSASMSDRIPFLLRVANSAVSSVMYLWKEMWPTQLAISYPHPLIGGTLSPAEQLCWGVLAAFGLTLITAIVLWELQRAPYLAVGWFWYLGTLVPVIGLIQVGVQGMADRYTYLPMIGVTIMGVWSAAALVARWPLLRWPTVVAVIGLLSVWSGLAYKQTATWKDSFTVFEHAVTVVPGNYFAHCHWGLAYSDLAAFEDARRNETAAIKARDLAGEQYAIAVKLAPHYDAANCNLGWYYSTLEKYDQALPYFLLAAEINPNLAAHQTNLAITYFNLGRLCDAAKAGDQALELNRKKGAHSDPR